MQQPAFTPGASTRPVTKLELSISCSKLINKDLLSKSDPFVVVYLSVANGRKMEIGRTETIQDNLNPIFEKKFLIDYFFEERQLLDFHVYDSDSNSRNLADHDFLGEASMALGEIVSARNCHLERPLVHPYESSCGVIAVRSEELSDSRHVVSLQMRGNKLDKKDFFGKSDPFLNIYRCNEDRSWTLVKRTEVIKNTLDPSWRPFEVGVVALCNDDFDRSIRFECLDWNSDGSEDFIGEFSTTLRELTGQDSPASARTQFELINPKKKEKKGSKYKHSGMVTFVKAVVIPRHSFLEYIRGGTDLNFTVAIDFTASNGAPNDPRSLHYRDPNKPNQYQQAIRAVGDIIQDYDADKLFPALGFGARLPPDGRVSHEFFLNFHPSNPHCQGVEGVLSAYQYTLGAVQLYGPTNFSPVINHVAQIASTDQSGNNYFVLLMITDGIITDFANTVSAIIHASSLPMSIIIVGVGNEDFSAMDDLDSDDSLLTDGVNRAQRDIVQFVPFRDFNTGHDFAGNQERLAKAVLAEVPDQVTGYMNLRGFPPGPGRENRVGGGGEAAGHGIPAALPPQYPGPQPAGMLPPYPVAQPMNYSQPPYNPTAPTR